MGSAQAGPSLLMAPVNGRPASPLKGVRFKSRKSNPNTLVMAESKSARLNANLVVL
jgi:hypothetical protein